MKIKADLIRHLERLRPSWCQVEKVVELSGPEFDAFLIDPQEEQAFLADSAELMHRWDGVTGCVLVLAGGRPDGVLVDSEGTARARYAAYLPQARSILNAELERAADHIVHQGTEHTASGYWCVYCEELAEKFGLIIPEGSGLDTMLKETLAAPKWRRWRSAAAPSKPLSTRSSAKGSRAVWMRKSRASGCGTSCPC
jgi:hypothetical protein